MGRVHALSSLFAFAALAVLTPSPSLAGGRGGVVGGSGGNISYGPPSSNAAASAVASTASSVGAGGPASSSASGANAQALANEAVGGFGGAAGDTGSVTTTIDALTVETPGEAQGPHADKATCAAYRSVVRRLTVTAVCRDPAGRAQAPLVLRREPLLPLDDHGDLFACRGAETLSYRVIGAPASPAPTKVSTSADALGEGRCRAGEALSHEGAGVLACRPSSRAALEAAKRPRVAQAEGVIALEAPGEPQCVASGQGELTLGRF